MNIVLCKTCNRQITDKHCNQCIKQLADGGTVWTQFGVRLTGSTAIDYTGPLLDVERKQVSTNTFVKSDSDKPMYYLIDPYAYEDLAKVMTFGAKKYAPGNWKLGDIDRYISALERHLAEVKKALADDDSSLLIDSDSGLQHGAALMFNAQAVHYFVRKQLLNSESTNINLEDLI